MSARLLERCDCGSSYLAPVFSLGSSPPTCAMQRVGQRAAEETSYRLDLVQCERCSLVQLSTIVAPEIVFSPEYPYSSGNSGALVRHFAELADTVAGFASRDDLVVDIGANDGTLLRQLSGEFRTVGVEPTAQAEKISGPRVRAFFSEEIASGIVAVHGHAKVITACNVLAHVDDLDDVLRGVALLLGEDGVLIAENGDMQTIVGSPWSGGIGGQWDTIYHEHLRYFSPFTFYGALTRRGFAPKHWHTVSTHGGSFRMFARVGGDVIAAPPKIDYDWKALRQQARNARASIRNATSAGGVWGIGATARATTLINYCGLDVEDIERVVEVPESEKIGRYIPGTRIPVVSEDALLHHRPPRALLLSWHMADLIVPKLRERGYDGEVIIPLPMARGVRAEVAA